MTTLFENISDKNKEKLLKDLRAVTITYPKGINILSNLNRDDFIGIIEDGSLELEYNDYQGNKTILDTIKKGEIFGTLSFPLKEEGIRGITKESSQVTIIDYNNITNNDLIKTDSYIIFIKNLIKLLSEQINIKNQRIELLTKKTTRDKLLRYFKSQTKENGNNVFTMNMNYTELSSYLSVDRSAMMREISFLKEEGFIKTNGHRITIYY